MESDKKLVDLKQVEFLSNRKQKGAKLKVTWTTHQGGQKRRGNPTVYFDGQ